VDPLTKSYPELTPYQFASNTPIQAVDLDGLERKHNFEIQRDKNGKSTFKVTTDGAIKDGSNKKIEIAKNGLSEPKEWNVEHSGGAYSGSGFEGNANRSDFDGHLSGSDLEGRDGLIKIVNTSGKVLQTGGESMQVGGKAVMAYGTAQMAAGVLVAPVLLFQDL